MSIEITRYPTHYQVKMGLSTYLFTPSDYTALFHAMLQTPADDVVWVSCVTADMVADPEDCGGLIDELDEAVERAVCDPSKRYAKCLTCNTEDQIMEMVDLGYMGGWECESCNSKGVEN
jgi:hypothetical protein